jgi:hypothetical protein
MAFVEHLVSKCLAEGSGWLGAVSDSVRQFGKVAGIGKMIEEDVYSCKSPPARCTAVASILETKSWPESVGWLAELSDSHQQRIGVT